MAAALQHSREQAQTTNNRSNANQKKFPLTAFAGNKPATAREKDATKAAHSANGQESEGQSSVMPEDLPRGSQGSI